MHRWTPLLVAALLLVGGCGADDGAALGAARDPRTAPAASSPTATPDRPPLLHVLVDGKSLPAVQGSFCWTSSDGSGGCEDKVAFPASKLPDAGSVPSVTVVIPLADAHVTAMLTRVSGDGGPSYRARVVDLGEGRYELRTVAPAGRYHVYVMARLEAGEAPGEFLWTVPARTDGGV